MHANVPLSQLVLGQRNPRWVKPERDAQRKLVASIRAFGLLEPLVVRPLNGDGEKFQVIAGNRRLMALRSVHKRVKDDPKISCEVRRVDDPTADALSLCENFARESMHPLDEAEAFAKLASVEGKGAESIAAEFGVTPHYVKQRMKLASLADVVKSAYRAGEIDTGTAEAFAAVPADKQSEIWKELGGKVRRAEQVRDIIANGWIDAAKARFDLSKLPEIAVSRDLFSDRVLVERQAFMAAQAEALSAERQALLEDGWKDAVAGSYEELSSQILGMSVPVQEYDAETNRKLLKLKDRREKLEAKYETLGEKDEESRQDVVEKIEAIDAEAEAIDKNAELRFSEETKSVGTAYLLLTPDGEVRREYRVPRSGRKAPANGEVHAGNGSGKPEVATSNDLSDSQLASTYTHQALLVRQGLLGNKAARRRVLALILHDKVNSESLSVRHDANSTTVHATHGDRFSIGGIG
jgi:ParB family transcriptional regulator, chromosome partitioning protein